MEPVFTSTLPHLETTEKDGLYVSGGLFGGNVPNGYSLLPAGVLRRVRVNSRWLHPKEGSDESCPFFYVVPAPASGHQGVNEEVEGFAVNCHNLTILGPSELKCGYDHPLEAGFRTIKKAVWAETTSALLVKIDQPYQEVAEAAEEWAANQRPEEEPNVSDFRGVRSVPA